MNSRECSIIVHIDPIIGRITSVGLETLFITQTREVNLEPQTLAPLSNTLSTNQVVDSRVVPEHSSPERRNISLQSLKALIREGRS